MSKIKVKTIKKEVPGIPENIYIMWYDGDKRMGGLLSTKKLKEWFDSLPSKSSFANLPMESKIEEILNKSAFDTWVICERCSDKLARQTAIKTLDEINKELHVVVFQ